MTEEQVREILDQTDTDHSGTVSYPEFVNVMSSEGAAHISRGAVKKYFDVFDKDGSGYITTVEIRHTLTGLHQSLTDEEMNQIMNRYDVSGEGQINLAEFEALVEDLGMKIVEDGGEEDHHAAKASKKTSDLEGRLTQQGGCLEGLVAWLPGCLSALLTNAPPRSPEPPDEPLAISDPKTADALRPLANAEGKVRLSDLYRAVETWQKYHGITDTNPEHNPALHWEKGREKGLGTVIYKANHIALIVSDVGKSAAFYSDVIGLQQIRRPDFDRHGAWFTMGNMELHLIKGTPVVHSGTDLIVGHISIETYDIDRVPEILRELGIPFRQNVSVPKGKMAQGSGTDSSSNSDSIVKQYFLRDPDEYYLEICNCDVLTQYCLGETNELHGYDHGVGLDTHDAGVIVNMGLHIAHLA